MVTQNQVTQSKDQKGIENRGAANLLADIQATTTTDEAGAELILSTAAARVRKVDRSATVRVRREWTAANEHLPQTVMWCVWAYLLPGGIVEGQHETQAGALAAFNRAMSKAEQQRDIEARIRREFEEAERVRIALEQTEPLSFRDTGEATTGTLPLISNGPSGIGGEYQREVRP